MRNYFRAGRDRYFFFDGDCETDTERVFELARATGLKLCVFAVPRYAGSWDRVPVIGYRRRGEILADLGMPSDAEHTQILTEELASLDALYSAAGRAAPIQAVAA